MGGVNVDSRAGTGGRRALDSEINMIPMIDLLMVTISFLLITAVWSHMARLNADAQVPGTTTTAPATPVPPSKQLHVEMRSDDKFVLVWKQAGAVIGTSEIPRRGVVSTEGAVRVVRYPDLADKVASEWATTGTHRDASDRKFDQAVLHTGNEMPYASIVAVMDALLQVKRPIEVGQKIEQVSAFNLTFAMN
jgi:biopolymer transport protein ExbD